MYEVVRKYPYCSVWFLLLAATLLASNLFLNPYLSGQPILSWAGQRSQLQLQFAYFPETGMRVLESWGPGSKERYLHWIWIDIVFALSYGPFFHMLLRNLAVSRTFYNIPLVEMGSNLTETSMEFWWVGHHSHAHLMTGLFLSHCIVATIKWSLVPIYLGHTIFVIINWFKARGINRSLQYQTPTLGDAL